jgi:hypothetical protein
MRLNWINDLGAPAAVTVANIAAKKVTTPIAGQSFEDLLAYVVTLGGYAAYGMGWTRSEFIKNVAIAYAPLAFDKLYTKFAAGGMARMSRPVSMPMRAISRYPGPAAESPFQGIRLV